MDLDKKKQEALDNLSPNDLKLVICKQSYNLINELTSDDANNVNLYKLSKVQEDLSEYMVEKQMINELVHGIIHALIIKINESAGTSNLNMNYLLNPAINLCPAPSEAFADLYNQFRGDDNSFDSLIAKNQAKYPYIIHGVKFTSLFDKFDADLQSAIEMHEDLSQAEIFELCPPEYTSKLKQLKELLRWYSQNFREFSYYRMDDKEYARYKEAKDKINAKYEDLSKFYALETHNQSEIIKAIINLGESIE